MPTCDYDMFYLSFMEQPHYIVYLKQLITAFRKINSPKILWKICMMKMTFSEATKQLAHSLQLYLKIRQIIQE